MKELAFIDQEIIRQKTNQKTFLLTYESKESAKLCGLFEFVIKINCVGAWVLGFVGDAGQIVAWVEWAARFYKILTRDEKFLA